jgi:glycosyltransferase involved in cell wall biosynthesis
VKIAFVARSLGVGGAERQLVELARGLRELGHAVSVKLFYGDGQFEPELRAAGVPVHVLGKQGRWDVTRFLARLAGALRAERPDIVHSYLPVPNLFMALLKPALPGTRIVWAIRASDMNRIALDGLSRAAYRLEAVLSSVPDLIIVNSRAGFDFGMERGIAAAKMLIVPNGIDTERFRPIAAGGARVRAELGLSPEETAIGIIARLDPIKDHRTFVTAAAMVARARRGLRFVVIGEGPDAYRDELATLGRRLGLDGIVWAGRRTDMPEVYSALDVVCSSSLSEGFPNVVAEAMACGRPCVVTNAGDSADIVGTTGVVVPTGDPAALARGLAEMLDRLAASPGCAGPETRERIVARFGRAALRSRTAAIFADLLGAAPVKERRVS